MPLLLRPGLRLVITRKTAAGATAWFASLTWRGHSAVKDGFGARSAAFRWAQDQAARFEAFAVS